MFVALHTHPLPHKVKLIESQGEDQTAIWRLSVDTFVQLLQEQTFKSRTKSKQPWFCQLPAPLDSRVNRIGVKTSTDWCTVYDVEGRDGNPGSFREPAPFHWNCSSDYGSSLAIPQDICLVLCFSFGVFVTWRWGRGGLRSGHISRCLQDGRKTREILSTCSMCYFSNTE